MSFKINEAVVVQVFNKKTPHDAPASYSRFYYGISPAGRVQTSWCLAGARMFPPWNTERIRKAIAAIERTGRRGEAMLVRARVRHCGRIRSKL